MYQCKRCLFFYLLSIHFTLFIQVKTFLNMANEHKFSTIWYFTFLFNNDRIIITYFYFLFCLLLVMSPWCTLTYLCFWWPALPSTQTYRWRRRERRPVRHSASHFLQYYTLTLQKEKHSSIVLLLLCQSNITTQRDILGKKLAMIY